MDRNYVTFRREIVACGKVAVIRRRVPVEEIERAAFDLVAEIERELDEEEHRFLVSLLRR